MQGNNAPIMVTIVCLAYNHAKYIKQCLDGFVMQETKFRFEAIVHDDASTDDTADIIREYAALYPAVIKPIIQTENQYSKGTGIIENVIMRAARGKYIALCEGDDYWTDAHKLQCQVDFLENNTDYGMCFHDAALYDEQAHRITSQYYRYKKDTDVSAETLIMKGGSFCPTNSICFRRELYEAAPKMVLHQYVGDYPLQVYLGIVSKVRYLTRCMSVYRVNNSQAWSQRTLGMKEFEKFKPIMEKEMKIYRDFSSCYPEYAPIFERKKYKYMAYYYAIFEQSKQARRAWLKQPWKDREMTVQVLARVLGLSKLYHLMKRQ